MDLEIMKWVRGRTELMWLSTETDVGLLQTRWWTFRFHKMWSISWLA